MEILVWVIVLMVGLIVSFIDSAFKMGYGIATPILILIGFNPIVIVSLLLFSQLFAGLTRTIYYSAYVHIPYDDFKSDALINSFYIFTGMIGMIVAMFFIYITPKFATLLYIALMIIAVGIITLINYKFKFTLKKFYIISIISGFNQTISGAGYGPLATYQEILKNGNYQKTQAITSISEAILSGFGFLLYFIFFDILMPNLQLTILLIVTGIIGSPLGALSSNYLDRKKAKKVIGVFSIMIGIILFLRVFKLI